MEGDQLHICSDIPRPRHANARHKHALSKSSHVDCLHRGFHVCLCAQIKPHKLSCGATQRPYSTAIGCILSFIMKARHNNGIEEAKAKAKRAPECPSALRCR